MVNSVVQAEIQHLSSIISTSPNGDAIDALGDIEAVPPNTRRIEHLAVLNTNASVGRTSIQEVSTHNTIRGISTVTPGGLPIGL